MRPERERERERERVHRGMNTYVMFSKIVGRFGSEQ
jgi:hypothetical protein